MSTFSNTSTPAGAETTAFAPPPADSVTVLHFREASEAHLGKLNRDLGLSLDRFSLARLQSFFRDGAHRDPTVGELRLLDRLERSNRHAPCRLAVGELMTASDAVAATWADMMETHGILHRVGELKKGKTYPVAPPCTLTDALSLSGRYLYRTGLKSPVQDGQGNSYLLLSPAAEGPAAAEGYVPVARLSVGAESRSLWRRHGDAPYAIPPRTGDFLLVLPDLTPASITALLEADAAGRPVIGELRAVAGESLLSVLTAMGDGVDLYADRITTLRGTTAAGRVPAELLCEMPAPRPDGTVDCLLRVPLKGVHAATEIIRSLHLTATVCGQLRTGERTVIRIRNAAGKEDIPVVELPTAFLRATAAVYLHRYEVERQTEKPIPPALPPISRQPSPYAAENGLTPEGVDLTPPILHEGQILAIPEADMLVSAVTLTLTEGGMGYASAADAAVTVSDRLAEAGVDPAAMALSVSVTVGAAGGSPAHPTDSPPESRPSLLTSGMIPEVLCGLYRVAMDRELPVDDPAWAVDEGAEGIRLTVVGWGYAPSLREDPALSTDRQWRYAGAPVHKESPLYLFPHVGSARIPCLSALAAALNRNAGAGCALHPVTVASVKNDTDGLTRHALTEESAAALAEALRGWSTPVFALSHTETRLLLESPPVLAALERRVEMGYPVIVLGEACRAFAQYGLLPEALGEITDLTPAAKTATVTYRFPAEPSVRLLRGRLLAVKDPAPREADGQADNGMAVTPTDASKPPRARFSLAGLFTRSTPYSPAGAASGEIPAAPVAEKPTALLALRLPDGTTVPDGFVGKNKRVLGLLNGMDTATLPLLAKHSFDL